MKEFLALFIVGFSMSSLSAQISTIPDIPDPNDSLVLTVNLTRVTAQGQNDDPDALQRLVDAATAGEDMYIWTWNPALHPLGHPYVNGFGDRDWKNSNDTLKMIDMGNLVYKYVFRPTLAEWYEVEPSDVYKKGLSFLMKTKDGGGWDDPDIKTPDFNVSIDPPNAVRPPFGAFPSKPTPDDVVSIIYDYGRDTIPAFTDYAPLGDLNVYIEGRDEAGNKYNLHNFFSAGYEDELKMTYYEADGEYRFRFVLRELLTRSNALNPLPDGVEIANWRFVLIKSGTIEQHPVPITIDIGCN